ncbi:hypothetical protein K6U06_14975 [Acidiferrimicrobium sp. IK]|uniref:hypothetical protein n=1 Tax=Acidiferrimicrobium sp. IK TaxID=2871700 RepID=UPI0021CB939D|nr:hypothetical protein [Acidiferrimicrobium sp. IK]MCU4185669.1 hypothetical protein [Acidiferrimicrobium sp. IK]
MTGRVEVMSGPGVVMRYGRLCVWAGARSSDALLQFLGQSARNLGPSARGGALLAEHVAGVLERGDPEPDAAFVTLGPDGAGGYVALLHGPVRAWTGVQWVEPPVSPGWQRVAFAPAPVVLAGSASSQPAPGGSHPALDLETGTVPGGGFALIDADPSAPSPAGDDTAGPAPVSAPTPTGATPAVVAAAAAAASDAANTASPVGSVDPGGPGGEDIVAVAFAAPDRPDPGPRGHWGGPGGRAPEPDDARDTPTAVLSVPGAPSDAATAMTVALPHPVAAPAAAPTPGDPAPTGPGPAPARPRPHGAIGLLPPPGGLVPGPPVGPVGSVPVVRGVRCARGHFNHPEVTVCVCCGEAVGAAVGAAPAVVSGPRPSLGVLVVDDGSIYALDRPYLLGSRVSDDPAVTGGSARALMLRGERVAAVHAEIRLSDWTLSVLDRASSGSTHVLLPGADGWSALAPFQPTVLPPGAHIAVGSRVLTFVSPWPG